MTGRNWFLEVNKASSRLAPVPSPLGHFFLPALWGTLNQIPMAIAGNLSSKGLQVQKIIVKFTVHVFNAVTLYDMKQWLSHPDFLGKGFCVISGCI